MTSLSHSQLETWQQCPAKWAFQKIHRKKASPSEALITGSAAHYAIEQDGLTAIESHGKHSLPLPALVSLFGGALDRQLQQDDPDGLLSRDAIDTMKTKGLAILRAYVEQIQPYFTPSSVEEAFSFPLPGMPDWDFTGRIDARAKLRDGSVGIVDWKTASKPWPVSEEHKKPQASAYLWAEAQRPQPERASKVIFIVLGVTSAQAGAYRCDSDIRITQRTSGQIAAYVGHVTEAAQAIEWAKERNVFEPRTGPLCCYCGYIGQCPDGQRYAADTGRNIMVPVMAKS
jgi:hypothetical protein